MERFIMMVSTIWIVAFLLCSALADSAFRLERESLDQGTDPNSALELRSSQRSLAAFFRERTTQHCDAVPDTTECLRYLDLQSTYFRLSSPLRALADSVCTRHAGACEGLLPIFKHIDTLPPGLKRGAVRQCAAQAELCHTFAANYAMIAALPVSLRGAAQAACEEKPFQCTSMKKKLEQLSRASAARPSSAVAACARNPDACGSVDFKGVDRVDAEFRKFVKHLCAKRPKRCDHFLSEFRWVNAFPWKLRRAALQSCEKSPGSCGNVIDSLRGVNSFNSANVDETARACAEIPEACAYIIKDMNSNTFTRPEDEF